MRLRRLSIECVNHESTLETELSCPPLRVLYLDMHDRQCHNLHDIDADLQYPVCRCVVHEY